jgi:hypothetical protein
MNTSSFCQYEAMTAEAAVTGNFSAELKVHLETCESCREIVYITRQLVELRDASVSPDARLEARRIWLKYQITQKQRVVKRFERTVSAAAAILAAGVVVGAAIWGWPQLSGVIAPGLAPAAVAGAAALAVLITEELVVS